MESLAAYRSGNGLVNYYHGTMDGKTKPKSNLGPVRKKKCESKKKGK